MDEVEIRELLIDHVGHRCCWGSRPARTWRIHAVEDCNVYVGTLDTFIEEREIIRETEPYLGGSIDGKDNGPELGIWELDLRSQFPVLFEPYKEVWEKIPHSEVIEKCTGKFWIFVSKIHKIQYVHIYTAIFLLFPFISPNKTLEIIFSLCRTGKYSLCYMQCRPRTWIL